MFASFKINGHLAIKEAFDKLGKAAPKEIKGTMRELLKPVLSDVRAAVPVKSGKARKSIKIRTMRSRKGRIRLIIGASAKAFTGKTFYLSYLELGAPNRGIAPRRFITKTFAKHKNRLRSEFPKRLRERIRRAVAVK